MPTCNEHSGLEARINNLEENKPEVWEAIDNANKRIDSMKNWVIAGMSSLLMQAIIFIGTILLLFFKVKP